jgi:hypothetical protein
MTEVNPYEIPAGPELDQLIHHRVMGQSDTTYPPYSTDEKTSRRVLTRIRGLGGRTVRVGRTAIRGKRWFARYESNASDGTEVLAETLPLAICRLALLRTLAAEGS